MAASKSGPRKGGTPTARRGGRPGVNLSETVKAEFAVAGIGTTVLAEEPAAKRTRGPDRKPRKPRNGGAPDDLTQDKVNAGIWETVLMLQGYWGNDDARCRNVLSPTRVEVVSSPADADGFRGARVVSNGGTIRRNR